MQKILVFQQRGSAESKIKGIRVYGAGQFDLKVISIDSALPVIIDEPEEHLPSTIDADLALDFLQHPDLSQELAALCRRKKIPLIASGKKRRLKTVISIPT